MNEAAVLIVGIAGRSGSGKSTVAAHIAARPGGVHVDADRLAHAVLEEDRGVVEAVRRTFGPGVFGPSGRVDRRRLGRVVFGSPANLAKLNAIVHPAVIARCEEHLRRARAASAKLAVVDAALLLQVDVPFALDLVIALRCDRETLVRRIVAKGGWTEEEVDARLDSQAEVEKHFYKADAVVDTGRDLVEVLAEVDRLVDGAME